MSLPYPQNRELGRVPRHPGHIHSGRFSDSRIVLLTAPSHSAKEQWHDAVFVPGYSGGTVPDFAGFPLWLSKHLNDFLSASF